jgi:5'(3')-deoxyribonucleotidase
MSEFKGKRFNEGKPRTDLLPVFAMEQMIKVLTIGAEKYGDDNWRNGMSWTKSPLASLLRHIFAFINGEDLDSETRLLHMAHAMCNCAFIVEYYRIFPQGDDRKHRYLKPVRIGLDIDEVLANWVGHWVKHFNIPIPTSWYFDRTIEAKFIQMRDNKEFWMTIPPICKPSDLHFEPVCYVTSRPIPTEWTEAWLDANGFPAAPVVTVPVGASKVEAIQKFELDIFVDDRFENFRELNNAGICCFLMDANHNQRYDVGHKRIYSLRDLDRMGHHVKPFGAEPAENQNQAMMSQVGDMISSISQSAIASHIAGEAASGKKIANILADACNTSAASIQDFATFLNQSNIDPTLLAELEADPHHPLNATQQVSSTAGEHLRELMLLQDHQPFDRPVTVPCTLSFGDPPPNLSDKVHSAIIKVIGDMALPEISAPPQPGIHIPTNIRLLLQAESKGYIKGRDFFNGIKLIAKEQAKTISGYKEHITAAGNLQQHWQSVKTHGAQSQELQNIYQAHYLYATKQLFKAMQRAAQRELEILHETVFDLIDDGKITIRLHKFFPSVDPNRWVLAKLETGGWNPSLTFKGAVRLDTKSSLYSNAKRIISLLARRVAEANQIDYDLLLQPSILDSLMTEERIQSVINKLIPAFKEILGPDIIRKGHTDRPDGMLPHLQWYYSSDEDECKRAFDRVVDASNANVEVCQQAFKDNSVFIPDRSQALKLDGDFRDALEIPSLKHEEYARLHSAWMGFRGANSVHLGDPQA